jgi:uncharacterized membrane protein YhaH (DUF805 family)
MSWGEIFFGFHGRINRKTYWAASIVVAVIGLAFNALLAYLATGNPVAPEVWQRPGDKSAIWAPVWLAYFAFLVWPSTALAIKRLHDRDRQPWLWYLYYTLSLLFVLLPPMSKTDADPSFISQLLLIPLAIFGLYLFFELGVLRGTPGPNRHGDDPMPVGYTGGDYSFLSLMLALEGRIGRAKWWRGILILAGMTVAGVLLTVAAYDAFLARHPELAQNMSNAEWLNSKEAAPVLLQFSLWLTAPALIFVLVLWSLFALSVKRLHDRGLSSWLMLVVVLPFVGVIISPQLGIAFDLGDNPLRLALLLFTASIIWSILQFGILRGETGSNKHGPDPLAR